MNTGKQNTVRVRFAPSPTGYLHIGGLRSALFNWLYARHCGGTFLVRIEDTDRERYTPEHEKAIVDGLAWAGIISDEPIVIQTSRAARHQEIVEQLLQEQKAYRCYCSYDELAIKRIEAQEAKETYMYDGTCRDVEYPEHYKFQKKYVVRFKIDRTQEAITFHDAIRGTVTVQTDHIDDFVLMRSSGGFMYNYVVVVDDHDMEISHVIRGEEHLINTPKQISLYQALGWQLPQFAHLPLILSPDGGKLSKRDGAVSVTDYAKEGFLPKALVNFLVRLGWSHQDQELFTQDEMIEHFSLDGINKKGAIFDKQKLLWVNSQYIKNSTAQYLYEYMMQVMTLPVKKRYGNWPLEKMYKAIDLYKDRVQTLVQLYDEMFTLYQPPVYYNQEHVDTWMTEQGIILLSEFTQRFVGVEHLKSAYNELVKEICKEHNVKMASLAQPLRIALLGESSGPAVFEMIELLDKQDVLARLQNVLQYMKKG
jgi:glutamyl-tRNA synthetase